MKNVIIGAVVGAVVGAGVAGAIVSSNVIKPVAAAKQPAAAVAQSTATSASDKMSTPAKQKVVYHINYTGGDSDKAYKAALGNIQNHINAVGAANMDLKVVLHGDGLGILMNAKENEDLKKRIGSLKNQQVDFAVCDNTLKGRKIDYTRDLHDVRKDDIVPSGVAELAKLQSMGYAYIKP